MGYASAGNGAKAGEILGHLKTRGVSEYVSPVWTGMVEIALGRSDEGYRRLEQSLTDRNQAMLYIRGMPWFKEYRPDPRWKRIDEKLGLHEAT